MLWLFQAAQKPGRRRKEKKIGTLVRREKRKENICLEERSEEQKSQEQEGFWVLCVRTAVETTETNIIPKFHHMIYVASMSFMVDTFQYNSRLKHTLRHKP